MQKYKSHKVVEAAKMVEIVTVYGGGGSGQGITAESEVITLDRETFNRITQAACEDSTPSRLMEGYLVRYEDGYLSWSPAEAFDNGYTELDETSVHALAEDFHLTYERIAAGAGWDTQEDCRVPFDELPIANRETMLAVCAEIADRHGLRQPSPSGIHPAPEAFTALELETDAILRYFHYEHLPPALREASQPFCELAALIVRTLPRSAERTVALRKLLEGKDAAVRSNV